MVASTSDSDVEVVSATTDDKTDGVDLRATALAFVFPALGGLLFGYDIGATSGRWRPEFMSGN